MALSLSIDVDIAQQQLALWHDGDCIKRYAVSTALAGVGQLKNSQQTPLGHHIIRAKIGANQPINTVFKARRPTGEIYSDALAQSCGQRDWILTRILWLSGCEKQKNRLGQVDTMQRYIYIHGTPDTEPMGIARSHGCIRMRNQDILELFDRVDVGTSVFIHL